MNDQASDEPDTPTTATDPAGRRPVWSRRVAIGLLVTFGMFLLLNVVIVFLLAWRSVIEGQGGPLS